MIQFAPSILSADFSNLGADLESVRSAGADLLHIDVMDGHFVPNISLGMPVISSIRKVTDIPFDVHLMIERPENYMDAAIDAGADIVTIHAECSRHLHRDIQRIHARGKKACVALNPATPIDCLQYILPELDMVLVMSVNPGFGEQSFIPFCVDKIRELAGMIRRRGLQVDIGVDGGIGLDNVQAVLQAGANVIVSGSAFFNAPDRVAFVQQLKGM